MRSSYIPISHGGGSFQEGREEGETSEGNNTVLLEQVRAEGWRKWRLHRRLHRKSFFR